MVVNFLILLATIMCISGCIVTLFGAFVLIKLFQGKKKPMDTSNRINHIRLVWFAITRPELFVNTFEWLKHDEYDNTKPGK